MRMRAGEISHFNASIEINNWLEKAPVLYIQSVLEGAYLVR